MEQSFNLLSNAIKFTARRVTFRYLLDVNSADSVRDTGSQIKRGLKLFNPSSR